MEVALERDETIFAAVHSAAGGGTSPAAAAASTPFDHAQFARINIDDAAAHNHHHQQQLQQPYPPGALGGGGNAGTTGGGEWNSPEKNHPQQAIKLPKNAWQTNHLSPGQAPPQPLMMLAPQPPMHQHQKGKPMGGFSPIGGKPQSGGGPRGDGGGYGKDGAGSPALSWEERLRKAQGAKERAEGGRPREFGADANGGGQREGGPPREREGGPPRGRGGGERGGRGRGRGGRMPRTYPPRGGGNDEMVESRGGFGVQYVEVTENCGGFGATPKPIADNYSENCGGFGANNQFKEQPVEKCGGFGERSYGDRGTRGGGREHRGGGGWKGGFPPEAVAQAQQGGDAGAFPMMPFGMQGMQGGGGGGWRGGMRGGNGGGAMASMHMQMRGAAAAAARGAPHPMMMRGPMGGGFPMMAGGPASPMQQQDERFRSTTWSDAGMGLPTLMGIPGPMMNPMMGGGGFGGGGRGGPRGGFSSPRGGRGRGGGGGGFRGGRGGFSRDRESPRHHYRHDGAVEGGEAKEDWRTPVDSPFEPEAAEEELQHWQE